MAENSHYLQASQSVTVWQASDDQRNRGLLYQHDDLPWDAIALKLSFVSHLHRFYTIPAVILAYNLLINLCALKLCTGMYKVSMMYVSDLLRFNTNSTLVVQTCPIYCMASLLNKSFTSELWTIWNQFRTILLCRYYHIIYINQCY